MKHLLLFMLLLSVSLSPLGAQTNNRIKELQNRQGQLKKQIEETENLLTTTKKDVGSQLNSLNTLTGQIAERRRYIDTLSNDVAQIEEEIKAVELQLSDLEKQLSEKKENYALSLRYLQRYGSVQQKLMFVFSAKTFSQSLRRMRYMREYASYQQQQGKALQEKQEEVATKRQELEEAKNSKADVLRLREAERKELEAQEKNKRSLLNELQKKQQSLQAEIRRKRSEADKLNAQIDKLIAEEIEKSRKNAQANKNQSTQAKAAAASEATANVALSSNFEQNRGKFPVPISTSYIVVSRFGQYNVEGMRNVTLDNKGIDIQGQRGAKAKAIFNGEVTAVFQLNGLFNILIRHGKYISVYCNLSSTRVKQGDPISTGQELGDIYTDTANDNRTILHFQLRREREKLNPAQWLRL